MSLCDVCPRGCKVDRTERVGFCNENSILRISKIIEHFEWEEPCLSKDNKGVLAIFFSGCNLGCDYCQNHEISRGGIGKTYTIEEFRKLIEEKQSMHSAIDLISPTHFSKELCKAFEKIDVKVPVIWNTNSYETLNNIEKVGKFVDVFLADFKYADNKLGEKFSKCQNYFSVCLPAIKTMCKLKPDIMDEDFMKQGVIIRHLVLPNHVKNSLAVLDCIKANFPNRKVSIMSQFTPNGKSSLNRKITPLEYKAVLNHMEKLGLENGFVQDFESANDCFVPNF